MRVFRWIIPALFAALILSTIGLVSAQESSSISGTVIDAQTGAPIQGALVEVEGNGAFFSSETGLDGTYEISGVPPGQYKVTASADGYEGETEAGVEVTESEAALVDFSLQPSISEEEREEGKQPGTRKGIVGTLSLGDGFFTVTANGEEVVIRSPEGGLGPIIRIPGPAAATVEAGVSTAAGLVHGAEVAVLVEFLLEDGGI